MNRESYIEFDRNYCVHYAPQPAGFYDSSHEPVHPALDPVNLCAAILRAQAGMGKDNL